MKSKVIKLGDFNDLQFAENYLKIKIADKVIFKKLLDANRTLKDADTPASKNDYVYAEQIELDQEPLEIHIELGRKQYPVIEDSLYGCQVNDAIKVNIDNKEVTLKIKRVRRVVEATISDELIEKQAIENVKTLDDYRQYYLAKEGAEIAGKLFYSMREQLVNQLIDLSTFEIDENDENRFCQMFEDMISKMNNGDLASKLVEAYGENGKNDYETCRMLFRIDNQRAYKEAVMGYHLASKDNYQLSEDVIEQSLDFYGYIYDMENETIEAQGLKEEALNSAYSSILQEQLKAHYLQKVEFITQK